MTANTQQRISSNLWKLYSLKATAGSYLFISIIILFFQSHGLTLTEIFLLQSAFAIGLVVWEIPSGYISDQWGRRNTAILAAFLYIVSILIYLVSTNFWGFLIGELILATGISFYSGTLEALLYDTLLELKREGEYRRIFGQAQFYHFGAEAVGSIIGGFLASISINAPVWATLVPFGIGLLLACSLQEPKRHKPHKHTHLTFIKNIVQDTIIKRSETRSIIALHAVIASMTLLLFWFTQPYQEQIELPLMFFGIVHALVVIAGATASRYTHAIDRLISDRTFLISIATTVVVSYVILGFVSTLWALLFFVSARVAWGFLSPLTSDMMNRMITSDIRATVLSVKSFCFRLLFAVISPIAGYTADILSLQQALLLVGTAGAVTLCLLFIITNGIWKKIPK